MMPSKAYQAIKWAIESGEEERGPLHREQFSFIVARALNMDAKAARDVALAVGYLLDTGYASIPKIPLIEDALRDIRSPFEVAEVIINGALHGDEYVTGKSLTITAKEIENAARREYTPSGSSEALGGAEEHDLPVILDEGGGHLRVITASAFRVGGKIAAIKIRV